MASLLVVGAPPVCLLFAPRLGAKLLDDLHQLSLGRVTRGVRRLCRIAAGGKGVIETCRVRLQTAAIFGGAGEDHDRLAGRSAGLDSHSDDRATMQDTRETHLQPLRPITFFRLRVEVLSGPDAGKAVETAGDEPITVGTSDDNSLELSDAMVSRYHLELRRTADGVLVSDLGSRNSSFVGSARIIKGVLAPETRLWIGRSELVLRDGVEQPVPPSSAAERPIPGFIWRSREMNRVAAMVRRIAKSEVAALIEGETGTGKEVVARAIHEQGRRVGQPYVVVDCGSLPATLIASELFGHERGAFTGAHRRYVGAFERAHGGTIFLDEIGELPLDVQPVLLGVLERRRFRRLGAREEISVDVRLLAATNRDLRAEVNAGTFRADLYYRLAVARILLPPLRERLDDLEPLIAYFASELSGAPAPSPFGEGALVKLRAHRWSGNVRELRNVVEAALAMGELRLQSSEPTPATPVEGAAVAEEPGPTLVVPYREARASALAEFERAYLANLIERCAGNASQAARSADMDRPYLLTLLRRHGLR